MEAPTPEFSNVVNSSSKYSSWSIELAMSINTRQEQLAEKNVMDHHVEGFLCIKGCCIYLPI